MVLACLLPEGEVGEEGPFLALAGVAVEELQVPPMEAWEEVAAVRPERHSAWEGEGEGAEAERLG